VGREGKEGRSRREKNSYVRMPYPGEGGQESISLEEEEKNAVDFSSCGSLLKEFGTSK